MHLPQTVTNMIEKKKEWGQQGAAVGKGSTMMQACTVAAAVGFSSTVNDKSFKGEKFRCLLGLVDMRENFLRFCLSPPTWICGFPLQSFPVHKTHMYTCILPLLGEVSQYW